MYLYYHILHTNATVDTYPSPSSQRSLTKFGVIDQNVRAFKLADASMFASIHDSNVVGVSSLKTSRMK